MERKAVACETYSLPIFTLKQHHNSHAFYYFVEANSKRCLNFVALVELLRGSQKDLK